MRSTRTNRKMRTFKVDSLLEQQEKNQSTQLGDYMTLMFLGYFDKSLRGESNEEVEVDTYLAKVSRQKRKDSFKALNQRLATSVVRINPDDSASSCPSKIPAVSVPTDNFRPSANKSYILQMAVRVASCGIAADPTKSADGAR